VFSKQKALHDSCAWAHLLVVALSEALLYGARKFLALNEDRGQGLFRIAGEAAQGLAHVLNRSRACAVS
jgi:hypothetical protein